MKIKENIEIRKRARNNLKVLEDDLERRKLFLEAQRKDLFEKEELFFSQQVGKYFKSESGKRFFKILGYERKSPYCECGIFYIDFFDLNKEEQKDKTTTCYNVFGNNFEVKEINKEEYLNSLCSQSEDSQNQCKEKQ